MAYDLTTGGLLTSFVPTFNAPVLALAVSPDQKVLYVGGQFTQVNGANRYRLVAFDLTKSPVALLSSFTATMDASVYGLAATYGPTTAETRLFAVALSPRSITPRERTPSQSRAAPALCSRSR